MLYLIAFPFFDIVYKNGCINILAFIVDKEFLLVGRKEP
jgi:hypothetical protein